MSKLNTKRPFLRALATNLNAAAFTAKIAKTTEPTGNGVFDLDVFGVVVPRFMRFMPFILGANDETFDLRLWGWNPSGSGAYPGVLWVPTLLLDITCIACASVGVANSYVLDTERFVDSIVVNRQPRKHDLNATPAIQYRGTPKVMSNTGTDIAAWVEVETFNAYKLEWDFDQTSGTGTMNSLMQPTR